MAKWKKIIVSGSNADLNQVTASSGLSVTGGNQMITPSPITTKLSGSFSGSFGGSFTGDGTNLTGVTATPSFPNTAVTSLQPTELIFVNTDPNTYSTANNRNITFGNLIASITGSTLNAVSASSFTGSFTGSFLGSLVATNGVLSGSSLSSPAQGQVTLTTNGVAQSATTITNLTTTGTPTFAGLNSNGTTFNIATTTATSINIGTTDATTINIGKASTSTVNVNNNLIVKGDLTVEGTTTTLNTENLLVEDRYIILASGSTSNTTGGILIQSQVNGNGYLFGLSNNGAAPRWAFMSGSDVGLNSSNAFTPDAYVGVVQTAVQSPVDSVGPIYGGGDNTGAGTLWVNTNDDEIWIWA